MRRLQARALTAKGEAASFLFRVRHGACHFFSTVPMSQLYT